MDASRVLGAGGSLQPFWKLNWRAERRADLLVDYMCLCSPGSGSCIATPGTSSYTNTSSTPSSHGLDSFLDLNCWDADPRPCREEVPLGHGDFSVLPETPHITDQVHDAYPSLLHFAGRWIRALTVTAGSVRNTFLTDMSVIEEEQEGPEHDAYVHVHSARFAQASISKMLPFVDDICSFFHPNTSASGDDGSLLAPAEKLWPLLAMREAMSSASQDIRLSSCSTASAEAKRITDEMASLLLLKQGKLDEAIWDTMEETRSRLLAASPEDEDDDSWWGATPQGSPGTGIHKVTRATVSYINVLTSTSGATVAREVADESAQLRGYVPGIDGFSPLASLIIETLLCLEEKLAERSSQSFSDDSLRFLFLTNNSYFICQQLSPDLVLESHVAALARKIDSYIETYVQLTWAPVVSCLYVYRPLCLGRYSSPAMFESEFQKTYSAQKLRKVPDPKLRKRLREAVVDKIISSFTKYLEHNYVSPSRFTQLDLMDMLQELFEG